MNKGIDLTFLAEEIHKENSKWWRDINTGEFKDRNMGEVCMLLISEVAEAMEGERKNLMDDKLPHKRMGEVEMADVVIRLLDIAGRYKLHLELPKLLDGTCSSDNLGECLLYICIDIIKLYSQKSWNEKSGSSFLRGRMSIAATDILSGVRAFCEYQGYDLWETVEEKRVFNRDRADHKLGNRKKEGGKKW